MFKNLNCKQYCVVIVFASVALFSTSVVFAVLITNPSNLFSWGRPNSAEVEPSAPIKNSEVFVVPLDDFREGYPQTIFKSLSVAIVAFENQKGAAWHNKAYLLAGGFSKTGTGKVCGVFGLPGADYRWDALPPFNEFVATVKVTKLGSEVIDVKVFDKKNFCAHFNPNQTEVN